MGKASHFVGKNKSVVAIGPCSLHKNCTAFDYFSTPVLEQHGVSFPDGAYRERLLVCHLDSDEVEMFLEKIGSVFYSDETLGAERLRLERERDERSRRWESLFLAALTGASSSGDAGEIAEFAANIADAAMGQTCEGDR